MAGTFTWGGRQWGPGDQAAFAQWLRKHGANYRTFAGRHQAQAGLLETTPQDYRAQSLALSQAQTLAQPGIDAILADQKKARDQAARDLANNQGFTQALADEYKTIAPMVSGLYTGAAGETGQLAKGFADATTAQQAAETSGANDILAKAGAPAAAVAATDAQIGGPVGDVLYGTQGFIPAAGLAREGAAFGSAAAQLPAYAGGIGQQNAAAIRKAAADQDASFLAALRQERDKVPGAALDILQQERQNRQAERANQIQSDYLNNTTRNTTAGLTGIDPVTGKPTYEAQTDAQKLALAQQDGLKPNAALSRGRHILVDDFGNPILDTAGQTIPFNTGTPKPPKKPNTAAREKAFADTRTGVAADVEGMISTRQMTQAEQDAFRRKTGHFPTGAELTVTAHPGYVKAKKILFNKYKSVLRYATRAGRPNLRRRLNQIIDEILASYGIHNPNPALPPANSQPTGEHG